MGKCLGVVLGIVLMAAPMAAAAESPWASEATYKDQAIGKLKYGLVNTLLGWTSIVRTPMKSSPENGLMEIGRGIYNALGQTGLGVAHAVTFPVTALDVPLPEGGTDIFQKDTMQQEARK